MVSWNGQTEKDREIEMSRKWEKEFPFKVWWEQSAICAIKWSISGTWPKQ
jgi:hypothetical protein